MSRLLPLSRLRLKEVNKGEIKDGWDVAILYSVTKPGGCFFPTFHVTFAKNCDHDDQVSIKAYSSERLCYQMDPYCSTAILLNKQEYLKLDQELKQMNDHQDDRQRQSPQRSTGDDNGVNRMQSQVDLSLFHESSRIWQAEKPRLPDGYDPEIIFHRSSCTNQKEDATDNSPTHAHAPSAILSSRLPENPENSTILEADDIVPIEYIEPLPFPAPSAPTEDEMMMPKKRDVLVEVPAGPLGVTIATRHRRFVISRILPHSPNEDKLQPGDVIIRVNSEDVTRRCSREKLLAILASLSEEPIRYILVERMMESKLSFR